MLKLKLQYFSHLMQRANSLKKIQMLGKIEGRRRRGQQRMRWLDGIIDSMEKTLMLGKIEGGRRSGQQRMRWLDGITNSTDMNLSKLQELGDEQEGLACCSVWGRKELDTTEQPN